jgi:DnaJ family protein C protein 11
MMCTTFHILVDLGFEQIQLVIGPDTGISVGWQRQGKKNAGSGELKVGPAAFGASAQYIRHFSSKSQGRITGKVGRYI